MSEVSVRLVGKDDVEFVRVPFGIGQWNCSRRNLEKTLGHEPNGCLVAEVNSKRVGHVFSAIYETNNSPVVFSRSF